MTLIDEDRDWHREIGKGGYILRCAQITVQPIGLAEDVSAL